MQKCFPRMDHPNDAHAAAPHRGSVWAAAAGILVGLVYISLTSWEDTGDQEQFLTSTDRPGVDIYTPDAALLDINEEGCIVDQLPRPKVVQGRDGTWLEVTFLNGDRSASGYRTDPICKSPWQSDELGRPIVEETAAIVQRAILVGHPNVGLLDPNSTRWIPRPCARPVPRILHFIWLCSPLAMMRALHVLEFMKANPTYRVFFWTDSPIPPPVKAVLDAETENRPAGRIVYMDAYAEARTFKSQVLIKYMDELNRDSMNAKLCAVKSHFWRYEAVMKYGGIYIDMDHGSTRGFDEVGGPNLWRWPFVIHKVCGANINNHMFSAGRGSGFLDFVLKVITERCRKFGACSVLEGTGPPPFAMSVLKYNASDIGLIGDQFFKETGIAEHMAEHTWR